MNTDNREVIGGISAVVGAELLIVLAIFIGAATYVNFGAIGHAIQSWAGVW